MDAMLVTNILNVGYLTGFTGSSGYVLLCKDAGYFVTDSRYDEQASREAAGMKIVIDKKSGPESVRAMCKRLKIKKLGVEDTVSISYFNALKKSGLDIEPLNSTIEHLRAIKDEREIDLIKEAVRRAEAAFLDVRPYIKPGATERAIALRLESRLKQLGSRRLPFDIILASGPNSAMPHAGVTDRKIQKGDLVIIDWGAEAGGYFSDITRTLLIDGPGRSEKIGIYELVRRANMAARKAVATGISVRAVDKAGRDVIKKGGHADHFGHGLGHGVGREVHELPRLSPKAKGRIKSGMVFTIEPGVYLRGVGGVRIEDMALVGPRGGRMLTTLPVDINIIR